MVPSAANRVVGEPVALTLTATNSGPDSSSVHVAAPLPAGLTFSSFSPSGFLYDPLTGDWNVSGITNGQSFTLTINTTVTAAGTITPVAEVSSATHVDPDSTPNNATASEDDRASTTITATAAPGGGAGGGGSSGGGSGSGGSSGGGGGGGGPLAIASASALALSRSAFPAASSGASIAAKRNTGATVRYRLSAAAGVRFSVEKQSTGRRVGGRCAKQTRANRKKPRCARFTAVRGSFTHAGKAGANSFHFTGRLAARKLARASYRLIASPLADDGRAGTAIRKTFRITP
jgi:uncharacterized repeat protein (TIGR01451 family)